MIPIDLGKAALNIAKTPVVAVVDYVKVVREAAQEEKRRRESPCLFVDGISEERFSELAHEAARETVRVCSLDINDMTITIHVKSQSGLTTWDADIDYSDFGHLTGRYWLKTENNESLIPEHYAKALKDKIEQGISRTAGVFAQE